MSGVSPAFCTSVTASEHLASELLGIKTISQEVHLFVVEQFPDQNVSVTSEI